MACAVPKSRKTLVGFVAYYHISSPKSTKEGAIWQTTLIITTSSWVIMVVSDLVPYLMLQLQLIFLVSCNPIQTPHAPTSFKTTLNL